MEAGCEVRILCHVPSQLEESTVVSQYRDYKNRDGQSWDRQFRDYCEIFFTVTANIVTANHMIVTAN